MQVSHSWMAQVVQALQRRTFFDARKEFPHHCCLLPSTFSLLMARVIRRCPNLTVIRLPACTIGLFRFILARCPHLRHLRLVPCWDHLVAAPTTTPAAPDQLPWFALNPTQRPWGPERIAAGDNARRLAQLFTQAYMQWPCRLQSLVLPIDSDRRQRGIPAVFEDLFSQLTTLQVHADQELLYQIFGPYRHYHWPNLRELSLGKEPITDGYGDPPVLAVEGSPFDVLRLPAPEDALPGSRPTSCSRPLTERECADFAADSPAGFNPDAPMYRLRLGLATCSHMCFPQLHTLRLVGPSAVILLPSFLAPGRCPALQRLCCRDSHNYYRWGDMPRSNEVGVALEQLAAFPAAAAGLRELLLVNPLRFVVRPRQQTIDQWTRHCPSLLRKLRCAMLAAAARPCDLRTVATIFGNLERVAFAWCSLRSEPMSDLCVIRKPRAAPAAPPPAAVAVLGDWRPTEGTDEERAAALEMALALVDMIRTLPRLRMVSLFHPPPPSELPLDLLEAHGWRWLTRQSHSFLTGRNLTLTFYRTVPNAVLPRGAIRFPFLARLKPWKFATVLPLAETEGANK
ncbi:hypothetical protein PAPYR_9569 [Paratrimastix pyriformis]|uniref:Uncharacterized protein n=1 Tax=Paratrimastix pyriformis TaxID=342808 RepID=A0ABQ8U839_9EUKA|nr:hypothetical protein PAPYR_9569 [Paratrimastix pyriformis]